jgi:hypothetical protein
MYSIKDKEAILIVINFLSAYFIFLSNGTIVLTPQRDLWILKILIALSVAA